MAKQLSDLTQGLIEIAAEVSHDPEDADWYDVEEYLSMIPNSAKVLRELVYYMHQEYL